jgi:hypothetical protein
MGGEAKLARCPRCKQHGLVAERQGIRVAVDIVPVDALGFGVAVASGVDLYWAQNEPGQPARILGRRSAAENPSWGPGGSQTGSQLLHAEHSCGAPARDMVIVPVSRPLSAPVTPGSPRGGPRQPDAPAGATRAPERPSRAPRVIRPPSRPTRCGICDKMIVAGQSWWGFEHATTVYAEHEDCP